MILKKVYVKGRLGNKGFDHGQLLLDYNLGKILINSPKYKLIKLGNTKHEICDPDMYNINHLTTVAKSKF